MRFFQVNEVGDITWFATKVEAHANAKKVDPCYRSLVRVSEVDVFVDKASVLTLLNGSKVNTQILRTWQLTARGGLKEVANAEG